MGGGAGGRPRRGHRGSRQPAAGGAHARAGARPARRAVRHLRRAREPRRRRDARSVQPAGRPRATRRPPALEHESAAGRASRPAGAGRRKRPAPARGAAGAAGRSRRGAPRTPRPLSRGGADARARDFHLDPRGASARRPDLPAGPARQAPAAARARAVLGGPLRAAGREPSTSPAGSARASCPSGSRPARGDDPDPAGARSRLGRDGVPALAVTQASIAKAPAVCVGCVFWQSRGGRPAAKDRWAEKIEEDWGAWGTLYHAEGDRLLGFMQYGPSGSFPRASDLPAGPPSADAVLVTCAYLVDARAPWVLQSLFLASSARRATGA